MKPTINSYEHKCPLNSIYLFIIFFNVCLYSHIYNYIYIFMCICLYNTVYVLRFSQRSLPICLFYAKIYIATRTIQSMKFGTTYPKRCSFGYLILSLAIGLIYSQFRLGTKKYRRSDYSSGKELDWATSKQLNRAKLTQKLSKCYSSFNNHEFLGIEVET